MKMGLTLFMLYIRLPPVKAGMFSMEQHAIQSFIQVISFIMHSAIFVMWEPLAVCYV